MPMCADEGMGILAFRVLGGGYFQAPGTVRDGKGRNADFSKIGREEQVSAVLHNVGTRHGVPLTSVSIAYVMQKVASNPSPLLRLLRNKLADNFCVDAVPIPPSWRPQGRAPEGQHRRTQSRADAGGYG